MTRNEESRDLVVDGETFTVVTVRRGDYRLQWQSGPDGATGFALRSSDGEPLDDARIEGAVRAFLAQVHGAARRDP